MNHSPLFTGYLGLARARKQTRPTSADDWYVLEDMKAALRRYLNAALIECAGLSRDLTGDAVDPDQLMTDLRASFDPSLAESAIQDAFADAFHAAQDALKNAGCEPITTRKCLPSGE